MKVYTTDSTREFGNAQELKEFLDYKENEKLVKGILEWKGRITLNYLTSMLQMDRLEAEKIMEDLEDQGFCQSTTI
jgi:tRNA G26 N,N-dimethylase Trm1